MSLICVDPLQGRSSVLDRRRLVGTMRFSANKRDITLISTLRVHRVGGADWNQVFQDSASRFVDLHDFVLDEQENGLLGDWANGLMYPAGALNGFGALGGMSARCLAAPFVLEFRNGFEPRPVDYHDVAALRSV